MLRGQVRKLFGSRAAPSSITDHVWVPVGRHYYTLEHYSTGRMLANIAEVEEDGQTYWQARHWLGGGTGPRGKDPNCCVWSHKKRAAFRTAEALVRKALKRPTG